MFLFAFSTPQDTAFRQKSVPLNTAGPSSVKPRRPPWRCTSPPPRIRLLSIAFPSPDPTSAFLPNLQSTSARKQCRTTTAVAVDLHRVRRTTRARRSPRSPPAAPRPPAPTTPTLTVRDGDVTEVPVVTSRGGESQGAGGVDGMRLGLQTRSRSRRAQEGAPTAKTRMG